jgi:acyl transferase domain-containing protein
VGAFLKEPTKFDNVEFGIAAKDALAMTASTRRLIELTFLACLDSGVDSRGNKIGVFNAGTNTEAFETVRFGAV